MSDQTTTWLMDVLECAVLSEDEGEGRGSWTSPLRSVLANASTPMRAPAAKVGPASNTAAAMRVASERSLAVFLAVPRMIGTVKAELVGGAVQFTGIW